MKNMKKILALLLAAVLCLGLISVAYAADAPVTEINGTLQPGDTVPNFTVTLEDGTVFTLSEALETHKAVMINIWATWCHWCVEEMPSLQQAYSEYSDKIALVCLSPSDENGEITAFKQANDLQLLPMGSDTVHMTEALDQDGLPTTIIIDRFGKYVFCHCGYLDDPVKFTRIMDYFTSDDYTETQVLDELPIPQYKGTVPTDEELTAALCPDGSVSFTNTRNDKDNWPFVVNDGTVTNSNALELDTVAGLSATLTAQAGDVLAFDYDANLDTVNEIMEIYVNGEKATPIFYTSQGTWSYEFPAAGDYQIDFTYQETQSANATDAAGTVKLSNARILSGADAEAVLAARPVYTTAMQGTDFDLEILSENAKQIIVQLPDGASLADLFGYELPCYIIPEETADFRMLLGDGLDGSRTVAMAVSDGREFIPVATTETDGQGYPFTVNVSCVEDGGNDFNVVVMYPDMFDTENEDAPVKGFLIFHNEENVNSFLNSLFNDGDASWTYADGSQPATSDCAQLSETDTFRYTITLVDENGEPVNGCMINVCSASNCCPQMLKDTNTYSFNGINDEPYAYVIHVLKVPAGYTFDASTAFTLNEAGDALTITVPHA